MKPFYAATLGVLAGAVAMIVVIIIMLVVVVPFVGDNAPNWLVYAMIGTAVGTFLAVGAKTKDALKRH